MSIETIFIYSPDLKALKVLDKEIKRLKDKYNIEKYMAENLQVPELISRYDHIGGLSNIKRHLESLSTADKDMRKLTLEYLEEYLNECRAIWRVDHDPSSTEAKQHLKEIERVRKYAKENLR